jgi:hypothetical protein
MASDITTGGVDRDDRAWMQELYQGARLAQMVHVAARLGIADFLTEGPKSAEDLARLTGSHPSSLYRLLRALAGFDVFAEIGPGMFELTSRASYLRSGVPGSLRAYYIHNGSDDTWRAWGQLLHTVMTGETAFRHVWGMSNFEYRTLHPEANAAFNASMTGVASPLGPAVTASYDFSRFTTIVDVGGGEGPMLAAILQAHPTVRGMLFDQPHVVAGAESVLAKAGVAERCEVVGGNFFEPLPKGGDVYILSRVVHDWSDELAIAILSNVRDAIGDKGLVLLVETPVELSGQRASSTLMTDMQMMVMAGGQERTIPEYQRLFEAARLRLGNVFPVQPPVSIIEALPA